MENESKMEIMLRRMEESDMRREESEQRMHAEFQSLKNTMESWNSDVEHKIEGLQVTVAHLQIKVDKLGEGKELEEDKGFLPPVSRRSLASGGFGSEFRRKINKEGENTEVTFSPNHVNNLLSQSSFAPGQLGAETPLYQGQSYFGYSGLPAMSCPQFDGDSPQMWISNCETYFETYGIHPSNWVRLATLGCNRLDHS
ncbi:hypothetical protein GUJ93_ZPchr0216g11336 [Zizania palustris]|uniref:Uncharacterized protein n=1 Tax=Zizania palustris TaxID=103762 RepID=A0A8J5R1J9_ZIZPA|nr:hypothetical protein GUJ93_ZPchr0216g11336 [Zizania palustris]